MTRRSTQTISRTQRLLDLVALLVSRRMPVTVEDIWAAVPGYAHRRAEGVQDESVRKMFERDKGELRDQGFPIETVDTTVDGQPVAGYRLASKSFYLPYLRLLRDEESAPGPVSLPPGTTVLEVRADEIAVAARGLQTLATLSGFPLQAEARSALRKLTFDLSEVLDVRGSRRIETSDGPAVHEALHLLTRAVTERQSIAFRYHGIARDTATDRQVQPWGLVHRLGHWYLVGHDATRDASRTFRVSRMTALEPLATPAPPHFDPPADLDLEAWTRNRPWNLDQTEPVREAVVRFAFPRCLHVEREGMGEEMDRSDDGSVRRRFSVRRPDSFLRWLLTFEGDAVIETPLDLAQDFRTLAASVAGLYHD